MGRGRRKAGSQLHSRQGRSLVFLSSKLTGTLVLACSRLSDGGRKKIPGGGETRAGARRASPARFTFYFSSFPLSEGLEQANWF